MDESFCNFFNFNSCVHSRITFALPSASNHEWYIEGHPLNRVRKSGPFRQLFSGNHSPSFCWDSICFESSTNS